MPVVSLQRGHNTDDIILIPHHHFIYRPHVMSQHSLQHNLKFVRDCYTLIIQFFGVLWDLNQNLSLFLFILSQAVSSYLCVHLLISLSLSRFPALLAHMVFSPSPLLFLFLSPHLCGFFSLALSRSVFPLFFPPLSPGNQTSGEEC